MSPDIDPQVLSKIETPAMALMGIGALNLLMSLGLGVYVVVMGITMGIAAADGAVSPAEVAGQLVGTACSGVLVFGCSILTIIAGMRMKNLQSYGLAMGGAIAAMTPCTSACCMLGLPIGIWCILTLNDDEVKGAFGQAALAS